MPPAEALRDPRRERARDALQAALMVLMMEQRYAQVRLEAVLRASGVGRSTFYEHFRDKDALLLSCMEPMLACLSALPFDAHETRPAMRLLEHLWKVRGRANALFQGSALRKLRRALIDRMALRIGLAPWTPAIPPRLAACALADTVLSPVLAWLGGEAWCTADQLACGLQRAARATLAGLSESS